jgi:hypothetical protein
MPLEYPFLKETYKNRADLNYSNQNLRVLISKFVSQ